MSSRLPRRITVMETASAVYAPPVGTIWRVVGTVVTEMGTVKDCSDASVGVWKGKGTEPPGTTEPLASREVTMKAGNVSVGEGEMTP